MVSLLCLLLLIMPIMEASKVLFLMPNTIVSHKIFYDGIIMALAKANHQITIVSDFKGNMDYSNVKTVFVGKIQEEAAVVNPFTSSPFSLVSAIMTTNADICLHALNHSDVQDALKEDYDLVIAAYITTDCFLPYIYQRKLPWAYASPVLLGATLYMANLDFPSIVPNYMMPISYPLSFKQRIVGTLLSTLPSVFLDILNTRTEMIFKKNGIWTDDLPSLYELKMTSSMIICNSVRELEYPARPFVPSIIFAGGVHLGSYNKLPLDLEEWIDSSGEDGFIFFSLGSVAKTEYIEKYYNTFIKVFSKLSQKVLWKWHSEVMEGLPENVRLSKWLPQKDILAHPKIKLFMSHGGIMSMWEATYFAVPVLGFPIFYDQHGNIEQAISQGWASKISWDELTEDVLNKAILTAINNHSMKATALKKSEIMRDQPMSPSEQVVYWMEYIGRHKGAHHLSCPFRHMTWIQIYNMDVWFGIGLASIGVLILLYLFLIFIIRRCIRKFSKTPIVKFKKKED